MTTITLQKKKHLEETPGYVRFVEDLEFLYNLSSIEPKDLRWAGINSKLINLGFTPDVEVKVGRGMPQLAINLHPTKDGQSCTGSATYRGPVLLRDVGRWGSSDLKRYQVTRFSGCPESERSFRKKPRYSLEEFLDKLIKVDNSAPVVEVVALLPIASDNGYTTEFAPEVRFEIGDHSHYKVGALMENAFNKFSTLTNGQQREIQSIDEKQKMYNWQALFMPDMSDMEKLMVPTSAGHMVLIAEPVEEPKPKWDLSYGSGGDTLSMGGGLKGGGGLSFGGGITRGATIGGVSILPGSFAGQGSLHEGDLERARTGTLTIYHIRFLGVKPDLAKSLTPDSMNALGKTLDTYIKE